MTGTLAHDGIVSEKTLSALERVKETGRKLMLVTGRELPDLKQVFPELGIFDKVVAENGALLYTPASEGGAPLRRRPLRFRRRVAEARRKTAFGRALDRRHLGAACRRSCSR